MAEKPMAWNDSAYDPLVHGLIFKPAPDITAYELARILQRVAALSKVMSPRQVSEWPRELQRHWRTIK